MSTRYLGRISPRTHRIGPMACRQRVESAAAVAYVGSRRIQALAGVLPAWAAILFSVWCVGLGNDGLGNGRGVFAAEPAPVAAQPCTPPAGPVKTDRLDPYQLAARIDAALAARWDAEKVVPAPAAADAEFVRRAYLDLVGRIPSAFEAREFLDDPSGGDAIAKRRRLIDNLLDRAGYAYHFANSWRDVILPGVATNVETRALAPSFETWLRLRFAANTPWDRLAAEVLTANLGAMENQRGNPLGNANAAPSPAAFYLVNERKPENLAASASRIFLGVQVQCAQCHDHPFAKWRRTEFWSLAAFFDGLQETADASTAGLVQIRIPETDITVPAAFLDGKPPIFNANEGRRTALARWATQLDNPFFAKACVNRLWDHFMGRGLVEPVDDLDVANAPSHPELFDELAQQFQLHGYDFKYLIRAIVASRAYQLSSRLGDADPDAANKLDPAFFARMPLRRMTAEQLFDSLARATGFREQPPTNQQLNPFAVDTARAEFQTKFANQTLRRADSQTTILQALSLMNGKFTADATALDRSETLAAVVEAPFLDDADRIETLFLATLSRRPTPEESVQLVEYIRQGGPGGNSKEALADVFWALLNSAEFILNH